jgi:phosphatidate cytidylyltransferase
MNETPTRIVSGFLTAITYVVFFQVELWNYFPLYLFVCAVSIILLNEFYSMYLHDKSDSFDKNVGRAFALFVVTIFYVQSLEIFRIQHDLGSKFLNEILDVIPNGQVLTCGILFSMLLILAFYNILTSRLKGALNAMSIVFFAVIYIPLTLSFILLLRGLPNGIFYIWLVSFIAVMTDMGGYIFGKLFGRHKLSLGVSPKKTWEGYIGAFFMQLVLTIAFNEAVKIFFNASAFKISQIICISTLIYATSVLGDLFESLVKRNADAKDSGNFLPGHGGLLDRVDSMMFSLPVFYFYILIAG